MRLLLAAAAVVLAAASAPAQCPGGVCPLPGGFYAAPQYRLAPQYPFAGPGQAPRLAPPVAAVPARPSPDHELWLEGGQFTWKLKAGRPAPQPMEPAVPADVVQLHRDTLAAKNGPPGVAQAEPRKHGGLFYRTVRNRAERQLADKLVKEKGYKPAEARVKAQQLVADLDDHTIDVVGERLAGVKEGIGDGRLIDWLIENREAILELIKFIVTLLAMFA